MFHDAKDYDVKIPAWNKGKKGVTGPKPGKIYSNYSTLYKGKTIRYWADKLGKSTETIRGHLINHGHLDRVTGCTGMGRKGTFNHQSKNVHTPMGIFETLADACEAYGKNRNCTSFVKRRIDNLDKYPDWYIIEK
jgi:hypothetical protein